MSNTKPATLVDSLTDSLTDSLFDSLLYAFRPPPPPRTFHIAHIVVLELLAQFIFAPLSCVTHERLDPVPRCIDCRLTHRDRLHFLIAQVVSDERHPLIQRPHGPNILPRHLWQLQKVYLDIIGQPMRTRFIIESVHMVKTRKWQIFIPKQVDRHRAAQILVVLAASERSLIELRPVVQATLSHILPILYLYFDIDLRLIVCHTEQIKRRSFPMLLLRIDCAICKSQVDESPLALQTEGIADKMKSVRLA